MIHPPIVTLLTDYGTRDYYVGAMKGAILAVAPHAQLVDITHALEPQDIPGGAFVLRHAVETFPRGTIHVAVVDPGVGTSRQILLGVFSGQMVIAPDNGLLSWVDRDLTREGLWTVENQQLWRRPVSKTFHGRDIMGPTAGHLAAGMSPKEVGRPVSTMVRLPTEYRAECNADELRGKVIYVDRFGNLVTNIHTDQLLAGGTIRSVRVGSSPVTPGAKFADVRWGDAVCYVGSCGFLEIAVHGGSAVERFGRDASVHVKL